MLKECQCAQGLQARRVVYDAAKEVGGGRSSLCDKKDLAMIKMSKSSL